MGTATATATRAGALIGGLAASLPAAGQGPEPVLGTARLTQMGLGLAVVMGLILLAAWLLRKVLGVAPANGAGMRVLGALSLGARERVVLVQVGARQLVLGVAPGRVQILHILDEPPLASAAGEPEFGARMRAAAARLSGGGDR